MKGAKPTVNNVIPMMGDIQKNVPDAPEYMTDNGRKVWGQLAAGLVAKDRLEPHYVPMFAAYCESVSNFIDATHCLAMEGKQQKKTAPWGLQQEAMGQMQRLGALFGMSPVDERRLGAGSQGDLFADVLAVLNGDE
jgi:P27 family predicted phage terminase small subunit